MTEPAEEGPGAAAHKPRALGIGRAPRKGGRACSWGPGDARLPRGARRGGEGGESVRRRSRAGQRGRGRGRGARGGVETRAGEEGACGEVAVRFVLVLVPVGVGMGVGPGAANQLPMSGPSGTGVGSTSTSVGVHKRRRSERFSFSFPLRFLMKFRKNTRLSLFSVRLVHTLYLSSPTKAPIDQG